MPIKWTLPCKWGNASKFSKKILGVKSSLVVIWKMDYSNKAGSMMTRVELGKWQQRRQNEESKARGVVTEKAE